jgi:hypothetical protein
LLIEKRQAFVFSKSSGQSPQLCTAVWRDQYFEQKHLSKKIKPGTLTETYTSFS